jgi:hypothetical protein
MSCSGIVASRGARLVANPPHTGCVFVCGALLGSWLVPLLEKLFIRTYVIYFYIGDKYSRYYK